ncbi:hypothetical protein ACWGTO_00285 [Mesorhizobium sp. PL10]
MTEREYEILANAWAQATGAQQILQALLIMLKKSGTSREFLEQVFDLAVQPPEAMALSDDQTTRAITVRTVQIVDHFRANVLG